MTEALVTPSEILDAILGKETAFSEWYPDTNQRILRGIMLNEDLVIDDIACDPSIAFVDCRLNGRVHIRGGTLNGLSICGGSITKPLVISGGTFNNSFSLQEIDASNMAHDVYVSIGLWGGQFNCNVDIYKGAIHRISIGNATLKSVRLHVGPVSMYNSDLKPHIKDLVVASKHIEALEVAGFEIEHLQIAGLLEQGLYSFSDVMVCKLMFSYFVNRGRVRLDKVGILPSGKAESLLAIEHSDLGRTRFSGLDFTRFTRVEIFDSDLTEVESSDTKWFPPTQLPGLDEEGKRDLYRQLKQAMIRQGNRIDELEFQAYEMNAYCNTLKVRTDLWDLLILSIGKYTNNFGTNYIIPAVWIIVFSLAIFVCSLWAQGLSFWERWGSVFVVMNPAHPIDYLVPKDQMSNAFVAIDFVGRILIGILIYQLIVPFRKFARG